MIFVNRCLNTNSTMKEKVSVILNKLNSIDNRTNRELYILAYELFTLFPNLLALSTRNNLNSLTWYDLLSACKNNSVFGVNHVIETTVNTDTILNSISSLLYNYGKNYNDLKYVDCIDVYAKPELGDSIMNADTMVKDFPMLVRSFRRPAIKVYPKPLYSDKVKNGDIVSLNTIDEEFQAMVYKLKIIGVIDFFRRAYKLLMIKVD